MGVVTEEDAECSVFDLVVEAVFVSVAVKASDRVSEYEPSRWLTE